MKRRESFTMKTTALPAVSAVLASVLAVAAWPAPAVSAPSLQAADAAQLWPRLFYNAAQRRAIEQARIPAESETVPAAAAAGPAVPSAPPHFVLQGMAQGRRGASAWINGEMLEQGETIAGRTVRIEPLVVRLQQAGQPDIVLRPGQQGTSAEPAVQDLVPPGSFHKK
jgi:hypothetical protein